MFPTRERMEVISSLLAMIGWAAPGTREHISFLRGAAGEVEESPGPTVSAAER
jgi:hypothetical protein